MGQGFGVQLGVRSWGGAGVRSAAGGEEWG